MKYYLKGVVGCGNKEQIHNLLHIQYDLIGSRKPYEMIHTGIILIHNTLLRIMRERGEWYLD